ncbi:hypothetical protein ACFWQC_26615 [Nocardioides sp. NPDC058538]|uniref:hypothetical protein n=1 Tax=Nocardioides sp. NPDC058538 TaxID=3346542 RepID=UPI00364C4E36
MAVSASTTVRRILLFGQWALGSRAATVSRQRSRPAAPAASASSIAYAPIRHRISGRSADAAMMASVR